MKATEFVSEHSDWATNPAYTPEIMRDLVDTVRGAERYFDKHGFKIWFSNHFFDQIKLKRGHTGLYTTDGMMRTLVKILQRGMQFFKGKVPGTSFVFYDPNTNIFIAIVRDDVNYYVATTTVRDYVWKGDGQVIRL